jgi:hypothetical protein
MLLSALLSVVVSVAPTPRALSLVIWSVGSEATAAASLATWEARSSKWGNLFRLSPGFPKVQPSSTWPELERGPLVVVLGVCPTRSNAVAAIEALEPGVFERVVQTSAAASCPSFVFDDDTPREVEGWRLALRDERVLVSGELRVVVLEGEFEQQGDFASRLSGMVLIVSRRGPGGALVDEKVQVLGGTYPSFAELVRLRREGKAIVLEWAGAEPSCAFPSRRALQFDGATTITPGLDVKTTKKNVKWVECSVP